jgi:hypothetical protein
MEMVEAEMPSLLELYRKWREFAIAGAFGSQAALCYNSANSNISSQFVTTSGVNP